MTWSPVNNDDSELGKITKQANEIRFKERDKSIELFKTAAEGFEKNSDYWNAAWNYKIVSDELMFKNNPDGSIPYLEKSIFCYQKVMNSENLDKMKRALAALLIPNFTHFFFSSRIGETPFQKVVDDSNQFAIELLMSELDEIKDEEKRFNLLFKGIEVDYSNTHFIYNTGLFRLLTEVKNFQMAVKLGEKYEDKLYYDDKAWLYVARAFADKTNALENLENAVELFSKDTHENFQKEGMKEGRSGWHIGSVTLWANFFKGQALLLQNSKSEEQFILQLRQASLKFKAIEGNHLFPSGTFLAILCEGLATFLETKDEHIFEKLQTDLGRLIGKYVEGDEKKVADIISALNNGFKACKENPGTVAVENPDLKRAFELISSLDNWALQNIFDFTKKKIGVQASFLLGNKSPIFEKAISDFETLLNKSDTKEELQKFLTKNYFLFGFDYKEIKAKHRLGGEYVMDYALRTYDNVYHLVEIEQSIFKLYKINDDPSTELVHAEQQVLNWLTWLEKHNSYAREELPNLSFPRGFIIIGRTKDLTENTSKQLMTRNALWGEKIKILTYDDLLNKAKTSYANMKKALS